MKNSYATDTMGLVLRLEQRRMNRIIKSIFIKCEEGNSGLTIPAIVLAEIGYLSEKRRIDTNLVELKEYLKHHPSINITPISAEIIYKCFEIDDIPELHDRLIAATACYKNLPLITNDPIIIDSKYVSTIW